MTTMANKLNSGESFKSSSKFTADLTFIRMPKGGKSGRQKALVGKRSLAEVLKKKHSVVQITNSDKLCCARAICVAKAWIHKDEGNRQKLVYENAKKCDTVRSRMAHQLHEDAGIPLGACGHQELKKFQDFLAPDYQLKVMATSYPYMMVFVGPEAPHIIRLLLQKHDDSETGHYDTCTSYAGFLERSYFCDQCNKGFDHNNFRYHPCEGRRCHACKQVECGAKPDYALREVPCSSCCRKFYSQTCYDMHKEKKICDSLVQCPICRKEFQTSASKEPHQCYFDKCSVCHEYVKLTEHKCFIQPVATKEDQRKKKTKATLKRHRKKNPLAAVYEEPPIFVYADFESMIAEDNTHIPVLVCALTSEDDTFKTYYGENCTADFLNFLTQLTEDEYGDPREVICIFHNLKGYDSMFLQHQLVKEERKIEDIIAIGTKWLSFKVGQITFKDSFSFLPMSLSAFTSTFGLTELKKGFFPHLFHTPDHQDYVGALPAASCYDPESMSNSKKKEFQVWYEEQVKKQHPFDLKQEPIAYC